MSAVKERERRPLSAPGLDAPRARQVRAVLLGYGRVGQAVASLIEDRRAPLAAAGLDVTIVDALVRDPGKRRNAPPVPLTTTIASALRAADVVVEVMGGVEPAGTLVATALAAGVPVVTANKTLVAYRGRELRSLAQRTGAPFLFEAAVVAGVPFIGTLARRPFAAASHGIEAMLNGTSHFVLTAMACGATLDAALQDAVARGYAEADSHADISGRDAAEKLAILLQVCAGWSGDAEQIPRVGIDTISAPDIAAAAQLGGVIKPAAIVSFGADGGGALVSPAFVPHSHPFARMDAVTNAAALIGADGQRVTFSGPGAGPEVTAATVLDDLVEAVHGGDVWRAAHPQAVLDATRPPRSPWVLRLRRAADLDDAQVIEHLATRGLAPMHVVRTGDALYLRTLDSAWATATAAVAGLRAIGHEPVLFPALPEGRR